MSDRNEDADSSGPSTVEFAAIILSGQQHIVGGLIQSDGTVKLTARARQQVRAARMRAAELVRQERQERQEPLTTDAPATKSALISEAFGRAVYRAHNPMMPLSEIDAE